MSDEGFLKRWSRKKRAETPVPAATIASAESPPSQPSPAARGNETTERRPPQHGGRLDRSDAAAPTPKAEDDAIDPATLPPVESLGPDSDYTVFFKKGVPEALRLAALRRAWMTDPFIRDFRSPAIDYGWDFTTPDYALRPGDDVAKMVDRMFPQTVAAPAVPAAPAAPAAPASAPETGPALPLASETSGRPEIPVVPQKQAAPEAVAPGPDSASEPRAQRRRHGGALPEDAN